jgi:hypothetical protein
MVRRNKFNLIAAAASWLLAEPSAASASFLRGDVDADGVVTLADAVLVFQAVVAHAELPCPDAADFSDNGLVQLGDAGLIAEFVLGSGAPPSPFPEAGADPTEDGLSCAELPPQQIEEDPASHYSLAILPPLGGQPGFRLRVSLESSAPLLGGSFVVDLPEGWGTEAKVLEARPGLELAAKLRQDGIVAAEIGADDKLRCVWLLTRSEFGATLAPGASRPLLDLMICPGAALAGEYHVEVASGADIVTEEAHRKVVQGSGTNLTLKADGAECPEVEESVATVRAYHYLSDASVEVGGAFRISLLSTCNTEAYSVGYLLRWDPLVIKVLGAEKTRAESFLGGYLANKDDYQGLPSWHTAIPYADQPMPGFPGVRICDPCGPTLIRGSPPAPDAYIIMSNYSVPTEPRRPFPVHTEMHHMDIIFEVLPTAQPGTTSILFFEDPGTTRQDNYIDPYLPKGDPVNRFQALPLISASVTILPASGSTRFLRGDANVDGALGMSDAIFLLHSLFGGQGFEIACRDAADSNDDGRVDISDPIYVLTFLFLGGPAPPQPFPEPGIDPTDDGLTCDSE